MSSLPGGIKRITLNGVEYGIAPGLNTDNYVQAPQSQFIEKNREIFWRTWNQQAFHNGERLKKILNEDDLEAARYDDAERVDVGALSANGEVKLQPVLESILPVQSTTMPMATSADGTTLVVGLEVSPYVKIWTNADPISSGWSDPTSVYDTSAVTDIITVGSTFYAVQGGVPIFSTNSGDTWSALSGQHTNVVGIAYANGDVYLLKSGSGAGRVYNHTQDENVSSITGSFIAGYKENVYWGADSRLYLYNGRSVTLYDQLPAVFNMTALIPYRGILLILGYFKLRSGKRGAVYYIIQGSENHLYSLGDESADYSIDACAGSDDEIYFAAPGRGGADRYDFTYGGLSCGPAVGTAMGIPYKSMAICEGYLFVGRYDNNAGTDGVYAADITAPSTYASTGWLETPVYDFDYPLQTKLYRDIRCEHAALAADESVMVEYSLDEGSTWTTAFTSNTAGDTAYSATLSDIKGNSIKLKATLSAGTSDATTPTLYRLVARGVPVTEPKYVWQLRLLAYPKYGGADTIAAVKTAYAAQKQLTFIDIDDTSHNVVISDMRVAQLPSKNNDYAQIDVGLREI